MKMQCAWCQKPLGEKPPLADERVSHGICAKCAAECFPIKPRKEESAK